MSDPFWYGHVSILWDTSRLTEFFPTASMTLAEKLNAIVRFGLYTGILLALFRSSYIALYVPIALFAVTKVLYDQNEEPEKSIEVEMTPRQYENPIIDALPDRNPVTVVDGKKCVQPTADNPFGNLLLTDLKHDPERPAACPITDPVVAAAAEDKFTENLWSDVQDVWGRKNASRQFYTMPVTEVCNDQTGYAKWLYGDQGTCKSKGMDKCIPEDLRQDRKPVYLDIDNFQYT